MVRPRPFLFLPLFTNVVEEGLSEVRQERFIADSSSPFRVHTGPRLVPFRATLALFATLIAFRGMLGFAVDGLRPDGVATLPLQERL